MIKRTTSTKLAFINDNIRIIFRGAHSARLRGTTGFRDSRPLRHINNNYQSTNEDEDILTNEINHDDGFAYESSAEFASSNIYQRLKKTKNLKLRGFYRSMVP